MTKEIIETVKHNTAQIARIAFTLEEILRLVKDRPREIKKIYGGPGKMTKDPFGFTKAINFDKLNDPEVLKELEKIFIKDAPLEERKEFVKKIKEKNE